MIFLRFVPRFPTETADLLMALATRPDITFRGFFTVVGRDHIRQRLLPHRVVSVERSARKE